LSITNKWQKVPPALPNVGDFVSVDNGMDGGNRANISGRVRSRLFRYIRGSDDSLTCLVNIVVEETDELVWAALVKE
jgi:hypothetical protein